MIKTTPSNIKIRLIHADPWQELVGEGWFNSRPELSRNDKLDFSEILKIDTPVSELAGFVAEMTVPILFREIICSARDHIIWARTSRVDNLLENWNVIYEANLESIAELQNRIIKDSGGETQDEFRRHLPLGYMTSFTTRMSIRSAIKMIKYFQELEKYPAIRSVAKNFSVQLEDTLKQLGIDIDKIMSVIKFDNYCNMVQSTEKNFSSSKDYIVLEGDYSVMLRAQIVRHRLLHIVDDLSKYFSRDDVWSIPVSDKMHLSIGAPKQVWQSIVSKRMCWLAHSSIWADIINDVESVNGGAIEELIPCKDGVCPYNEDCRQRIMKNDPGVPCPRHIALNEDNSTKEALLANFDKEDLEQKMLDYVSRSGRPQGYWNKQIEGFKNA